MLTPLHVSIHAVINHASMINSMYEFMLTPLYVSIDADTPPYNGKRLVELSNLSFHTSIV